MDSKSNPWKVDIPNEMERYSLYSDYTSDQKYGFLETIKLIDKCITDLQNDGELTGYIKINARIKAAETALENDIVLNKLLDDVFGIEILAGNESALEKIINALKKYMTVRREKKHDKENGYKATHKVMDMTQETFEQLGISRINFGQVPIVEIQFKTFEVKENATSGTASHLGYKGKTKEQIQEIYDNNGFNEHNLPIMYTVENHKIRILNKQDTIKELYPFLKLGNREREGR